jgi:hydrogenase maturation protein HypF
MKNTDLKTTILNVHGLIQGVGFRPFVYRLAKSHKLNGQVVNKSNGVNILLQGNDENIAAFISGIRVHAPKAAIINDIKKEIAYWAPFPDFSIAKSESVNDSVTIVSPDISVCNECLADMKSQPHRIDYPFINCTNCGPRFSIITNIPYDRNQTSMKEFAMCPVCEKEYKDIFNRRFHAQPIACNNCGPVYTLHYRNKKLPLLAEIFTCLKSVVDSGEVFAIKGIGGFHLACDPYSRKALNKLRGIKQRDGKPFAIMVKDLYIASKLAHINEGEKDRLTSWQKPIVLLKAKNTKEFPEEIACGLNTLGIFLPYMPFHYQLFENLQKDVLVMTSANLSNCPIITKNREALKYFQEFDIPIVFHNRKIINRVDDSVEIFSPLEKQVMRRSRGYTPMPLLTNICVEGIFATGAELSGAFALGKDKQIILSQYIGDLKNFETMQFYEESFNRLKKLFRFSPKLIACDMHPDYLSTAFAEKFNQPIVAIQHHHAHVAACMVEYGLDEKVIGIAYDGTGYGTDGKIWGSEIMIADFEGFERKYHFEYIPLPGGDLVSKEPWRSAYSYLIYSGYNVKNEKPYPIQSIDSQQIEYIDLAINNNINLPESCSAGRLFDAVAALINCCTHSTYHAEAPIKLENIIIEGIENVYPIKLQYPISWKETILAIQSDLLNNTDPGIISAKFHNTLAKITCEAIVKLQKETGITKVVVSGGTFQNMYLTKKIVDLLRNTGIQIFMSRQIPCNDGGIAAGQMAIAAKKNKLCV